MQNGAGGFGVLALAVGSGRPAALVPHGHGHARAAARTVLALGLGASLHRAMKTLFPRPRPVARRRRLEIPRAPARSFPSRHTIHAILIAGQAWALRPSLPARTGARGWAAGMAASRPAPRALWPSDLAGTALAVLIRGGRRC